MNIADVEKLKVKLWLTLPLVVAVSDCVLRMYFNQA